MQVFSPVPLERALGHCFASLGQCTIAFVRSALELARKTESQDLPVATVLAACAPGVTLRQDLFDVTVAEFWRAVDSYLYHDHLGFAIHHTSCYDA